MTCFTCGGENDVRKTYRDDESSQQTCKRCRELLKLGEFREKTEFVVAVGEWDRQAVYPITEVVVHRPWCHHIRGLKVIAGNEFIQTPCKDCMPNFH